MPFFTTPSVIERLRGVVERLGGDEQRGYDLLLFDVEAPEQRADAMRDLARRDRVAGLLIISLPIHDHEVAALQRDGLPAVLVDAATRDSRASSIDNVHGGRARCRTSAGEGAPADRFVGDVPVDPYGFTSSDDRRRGFAPSWRGRASTRSGAGPQGAARPRRGPRAGREVCALPDSADRDLRRLRPASDRGAQGGGAFGARVPEDVAVIGFDDVDLAEIVGLTRSASRCAKVARWPPTCCWRRSSTASTTRSGPCSR